jgi:MFS family permease
VAEIGEVSSSEGSRENSKSTTLKQEALLGQLLSKEFIAISLFQSIEFFGLQFYVGNVKDLLENLGDDDATYTQIFNVCGSCGFVFFPVVGYVLDKFGLVTGFCVATVSAAAYCALSLVPNLELQVVTFLCWTLSRNMLFATFFSYLPATFGFKTFGRVNGVVSLIVATLGLFNKPLLQLALSIGYTPILIAFVVLFSFALAYPYFLSKTLNDGARKNSSGDNKHLIEHGISKTNTTGGKLEAAPEVYV